MLLAPVRLVLMNVDLSFELQNFKAEFTQQFAVMSSKGPLSPKGIHIALQMSHFIREMTPPPENLAEGP